MLDAGAGTGHASRALKRRYPAPASSRSTSPLGMLRAAARATNLVPALRQGLCGRGAAAAGGRRASICILSNFMLPWCDPDALFAELRRVLAPRGLLTFTSLGPDTLQRAARRLGAGGLPQPRRITSSTCTKSATRLVRAGFAAPVLDVERYTLSYTDVRGLAADLKAVGARNAAAGRLKGLTVPRKFAAMQAAYESVPPATGRLPATYEVVFGQAWAPAEAPRGAIGAGEPYFASRT